jgi:SAM-dependent methyltransferase
MIWKPEELDYVACDYCGADNGKDKFTRADGMKVVECQRCGLAYLQPRPRKEFISRFYDSDYFTGVTAESGKGGLKCMEVPASHGRIACPPRSLELMKERIGGLSGKKILEIGCATGDFITWLNREGAHVKGLEISEYAADIARKRGLDVIAGTIEEFAHTHGNVFDIVLAFEVIEHVPSPMLFLEHVAGHIRRGGHLLLSTPNYASGQRYGNQWYGFTGSFEHLYFFSKDVLERMAQKVGLNLTYWESSTASGDTSRIPGFIDRRVDWLARLSAMSREIGLSQALRLARRRSLNYLPFGNGHKLVVVLQKKS